MPICKGLCGDPVELQVLEVHPGLGLSVCISSTSLRCANVGPLKSTSRKASMQLRALEQVAHDAGAQTRFV